MIILKYILVFCALFWFVTQFVRSIVALLMVMSDTVANWILENPDQMIVHGIMLWLLIIIINLKLTVMIINKYG